MRDPNYFMQEVTDESFFNATDQQFPILEYEAGNSYLEWGRQHGETYKEGIKELIRIRKGLLRARTLLTNEQITEIAIRQFDATRNLASELADELVGISEGAGVDLADIVVVNNYSNLGDYEDNESVSIKQRKSGRLYDQSKGIQKPSETGYAMHIDGGTSSLAGSNLVTHGSAKNYMSVIKIPEHRLSSGNTVEPAIVLSMVGCIGLAGASNSLGAFVSHINCSDGGGGMVWPAIVRTLLQAANFSEMNSKIPKYNFSGGNAILISSNTQWESWEVTPSLSRKVGSGTSSPAGGYIFHTSKPTNEEIIDREGQDDSFSYQEFSLFDVESSSESISSLLSSKIPLVNNIDKLVSLMTSHDDYPRSLCWHYDNGSQDPPVSCGGIAVDYSNASVWAWRGCSRDDENYSTHKLRL